jgi:hypothetical protein
MLTSFNPSEDYGTTTLTAISSRVWQALAPTTLSGDQ